MMWQDLGIMLANFVIAGALMPTVLGKHKPEPLTCALDAGMLTVLAVAFGTLGLRLSMIGVSCSAALWYVLLWQVLKIKRRRKYETKKTNGG